MITKQADRRKTGKVRFVAFQGEPGSFSEQAGLEFFGERIKFLPLKTFDMVFEAVEEKRADRGVIPIENTLAGSIHRNYDLLLRHKLQIIGEIYIRIQHCLVALPGTKIEDIRFIYSHPQALSQCEEYLKRFPGVEIVPFYDTAGSVKHIKTSNLADSAAIASRQAALDYGMNILAEGIESIPENFTRFLIIARQGCRPPKRNKSTIVFSTKNIPGALFRCLAVFALRDINLLKIESRPLPGHPGDYFFYLDFAGNPSDSKCKRALSNLGELTSFVRVLGSYAMAPIPSTATEKDNREGDNGK